MANYVLAYEGGSMAETEAEREMVMAASIVSADSLSAAAEQAM
jgi:hypothetical protein